MFEPKKYSHQYLMTEKDILDISFIKGGKEILKFSVNYRVKIGDEFYPAIRFDNSHGYAHIDRYWLDEKEELGEKSNIEVLRMARKDIIQNWKKYREMVEKFLGDV